MQKRARQQVGTSLHGRPCAHRERSVPRRGPRQHRRRHCRQGHVTGRGTAGAERVVHRMGGNVLPNVHSETGQTPLARWTAGWDRAGHGPVMPAAGALTEAFLWSALRTVTKTATVSLHGNTYQVEPALAGRKVELVFSPFNLEHIEIRHDGRSFGPAVPHLITRHAHPKTRPETLEPTPAPTTGIAYLQLVADA